MSLFMSSSVSAGLHNFAIFKTSLISLLPVFQTEDAICITAFGCSFLINLSAIPSNSSHEYSGISNTNIEIAYLRNLGRALSE